MSDLAHPVAAALLASEGVERRAQARLRALELARHATWLSQAIEHHRAIESALEALHGAADLPGRRQARRWLATLVTGHALAEEAVLYPAMALDEQALQATRAYAAHGDVKIELAALECLDPEGDAWRFKVERLRDDLQHHFYLEESTWFPALACLGEPALHVRLDTRLRQEFERYLGVDVIA